MAKETYNALKWQRMQEKPKENEKDSLDGEDSTLSPSKLN
jgi:hypothetical protein